MQIVQIEDRTDGSQAVPGDGCYLRFRATRNRQPRNPAQIIERLVCNAGRLSPPCAKTGSHRSFAPTLGMHDCNAANR